MVTPSDATSPEEAGEMQPEIGDRASPEGIRPPALTLKETHAVKAKAKARAKEGVETRPVTIRSSGPVAAGTIIGIGLTAAIAAGIGTKTTGVARIAAHAGIGEAAGNGSTDDMLAKPHIRNGGMHMIRNGYYLSKLYVLKLDA